MSGQTRGGATVPEAAEATPTQMLRLARAVNKSLAGETSNTRKVTVASGASSFTIQDSRCRAGRLVTVIPLDANAASATWYLSNMTKGSMTVTLAEALSGSGTFGVVWLGDGQ